MRTSALDGRHRLRWLLTILVALALVAAACGDDDDDGGETIGGGNGDQSEAEAYYAELEDLTGTERRERLIKDAKAAGTFLVYTADSLGEPIAEAFGEEFGIDVETFRVPSEEMLQRTLQEHRAGRLEAGIHISDTAAMNTLNEEGVLAPYDPGLVEDLIDDAEQDNWIATQRFLIVPAWNTDQVEESELPDDLTGFAEPAWQGRLAAEIGDYDWYFTLYQHYLDEGMDEDEIEALFDELLSDATPVQGHTASTELLGAGQHELVLTTFSVLNDRFIGDGAPIAYTKQNGMPIGPIVAKYVGFGIGADAANPAAALLFADWMVTDGLDVARDLGVATTAKTGSGVPDEWEVIAVPEEELAKERTKWQEAYAAYLQ